MTNLSNGTRITFTADTFGLRPNGGTGTIVGRNFFGDTVQSYSVREDSAERGYTLSGDIVVPADHATAT